MCLKNILIYASEKKKAISLKDDRQKISAGESVGAKITDVKLELGSIPGDTIFSLSGVQSPTSGKHLFLYNGRK